MVVMATRLIRHEIRPVVYIIDMKKKILVFETKKTDTAVILEN